MSIEEIRKALDASTLDYNITDEVMKIINEWNDRLFPSCHGCKYEEMGVMDDPCPRCKRLKIDYYDRKPRKMIYMIMVRMRVGFEYDIEEFDGVAYEDKEEALRVLHTAQDDPRYAGESFYIKGIEV